MSSIPLVPLEELMATRLGGVDPSKFADEMFELYSIPAYDSRNPEVVVGEEIGSTKQIVQPQDVLLSKIVPHIRRSWIVGPADERRQIASGEWIVFRSNDAAPEYLRHVFLGDDFHAQFMQTVSGVGGSLLRARPAWAAAGFMDTLLRCEDETGGGLWETEGNLAGNSRLKLSSWSRSAA